MPEKVTMKLKDGAAVDPDSGTFLSIPIFKELKINWSFHVFVLLLTIGLDETCHVLKDRQTGDIFMAVLGMVDITCGTNSYYKIQLLEDDSNKQWFVFRA